MHKQEGIQWWHFNRGTTVCWDETQTYPLNQNKPLNINLLLLRLQFSRQLHTFVSSPIGLSGSESLPHCEKEVGEPTSDAGGVGSSLLTSACPSTSMATRSLRDSAERGKERRYVSNTKGKISSTLNFLFLLLGYRRPFSVFYFRITVAINRPHYKRATKLLTKTLKCRQTFKKRRRERI